MNYSELANFSMDVAAIYDEFKVRFLSLLSSCYHTCCSRSYFLRFVAMPILHVTTIHGELQC